MSKLNSNCPLELKVEKALIRADIDYFTENEKENGSNLDFFLPALDIYIEVKRGSTERIVSQMARHPNTIVIQGVKATEMFCKLLDNSRQF